MDSIRSRRSAYLLFMIGITAVIYLQTARFSFLALDDTPLIVNNESMRHWSSLPTFFATDMWQGAHPGSLMYYRPLLLCWLLLNFKLFGLHGSLWHSAAVVLYLSGVLLAWRLAIKLTNNELTAAAAALFFAVHPVHVESVAWLSAAVDPLLSVFCFGGFLAYFRWRENGRREWLIASGMLVALSLFTKEAGAVLPVLIILYELLFPARVEGSHSRRRWLALAATVSIPVIVYVFARAMVLSSLVKMQDQRTWLDVVRMAPKLILIYLQQAVWPVHLAAAYDVRRIESASLVNFYLPLMIALGFAALTVWALLKKRAVGFFLLWWWVAIGPAIVGVLTFPEFDFAHDRYGFLGLYGLCFLGASLLPLLPDSGGQMFGFPTTHSLALLCVTSVLAVLSVRQVEWWKSDIEMYKHAIEVSPRAIRPHGMLGNEYLKRGKFAEALQLYRETVDLDPQNWRTNYAYAAALYRAGHLDESVTALARTVQLNPKADVAYPLWAEILLRQGRNEEAVQILERGSEVVDDPHPLQEEIIAIHSLKNLNGQNLNGPETKKR